MAKIAEGTWFAVPLILGGYAVGMASRPSSKGRIFLGHFFEGTWDHPPSLSEARELGPESAVRVWRVLADYTLIRGAWPILGRDPEWRREDWPVPPFFRRDESGRFWIVEYSDHDANQVVALTPAASLPKLDRDSVAGLASVEASLTALLRPNPRRRRSGGAPRPRASRKQRGPTGA
jgi:hypothetical protein